MQNASTGRHARLFALVSLALLGGCENYSNAITGAPYTDGLVWTGSEQVTSTTIAYKSNGDGVVESTGTIGIGDSCGTARTSTGTLTRTDIEQRDWLNEIIGNTVSDHPLNPGTPVFEQIGISVVAEQVTSTGSFQETRTFNNPDGETRTWEETEAGDDGRQTTARYHGVAADEYIVSIFPLDLWDTAADDERDGLLTLLSRRNPRAGDTWMSVNGSTIYTYEGTEKTNLGGSSVNAHKVHVYSNEDYTAETVLETCLKVGPLEDTTTFPEADSTVTEAVQLDGGCAFRFQHRQTGTEWWSDNALIAFEGQRVFVSISDYGWEWFEDEDGTCTRFTSTTKPTEATDVDLFVEYTVTTEESSYVVDTWGVAESGE